MGLKVRASSPFAIDLIRGALLLGKYDLQPSWSSWDAEIEDEVIKGAIEMARNLAGEEILMKADKDEELIKKLISDCFGAERQIDTLGELLDLALQNLNRLESCGKESASDLAIMKAEYYEETKTPMMLSKNKVAANAMAVVLAYAGFIWSLTPKNQGNKAFLLVPITLYDKEAVKFIREARASEEKKLPRYVTYEWALALWMTVNYDVNGTFKVLYAEKGRNRINVKPFITIDLAAERTALQKVFGDNFDEAKEYLKSILKSVLSRTPDPLAVRFTNALYQVAHHSMSPIELKNLGLREYASLLSAESKIPPVVRQMGRVAQLVKV